jgi:hypothetical protein
MINQNYAEILTIIAAHPKGIGSRDIFKITANNLDTEISSPEHVSKAINQLRCKYNAVVSSDYNNKNVHKITKQGIEELNNYNLSLEFKTIEHSGIAELIDEEFNQPIDSTTLDPMDSTTLDPMDSIDQALLQIRSLIKSAENVIPAPEITGKDIKIQTLERLGNLMSEDIKAIFDDIANDINKLPEAA